jgi:amino acid transporter
MSSRKPELFAREATGLVREIGFTLGVIIILSHVIGLGWQKRVFQFTGPKPMPTDMMPLGFPAIFWAFLICGIAVLITGYAAGYVTAAMPRSGGGYVTISRCIHPFVGYISGWLMFLAEAFSLGLIGVAVFEAIMIFFNIALAPTQIIYSEIELFIGGLVVIWVFTIIGLLGTKLYGRLMEVLFYIPAAITVLFFAMWIAGIVNPGALAAGVEEVMGASTSKIMQLAVQTGMTTPANIPSFFDAFAFALAGAFWAYMGWYATTFVAGEVKEANKKLPLVVVTAGLVVMVVYLLASSLSAIATMNLEPYIDSAGHKWSFFQAYAWLSYPQAASATAVKAARAAIPNFQRAWMTGIASMTARGLNLGWISWLIALGGVLWVANDIPPFLLVCSRTFFAMSFDRMMPEKFSYISERWHSPVWAIIATAVIALPAAISESALFGLDKYLLWSNVVGTDIFDAFFLTMFCLSCALLPIKRKDVYERAAVKHSKGTVVALGFVAFLLAGFCLSLFLWQSTWIYDPATWSFTEGYPIESAYYSQAGFVFCILVGILLYAYYWQKNKTRGLDMRTLYLSIPPE